MPLISMILLQVRGSFFLFFCATVEAVVGPERLPAGVAAAAGVTATAGGTINGLSSKVLFDCCVDCQ
jgi:hypothetical protein